MITINWTKNGQSGSREFSNEKLAERFAQGLVRTGYTIDQAAPVAEAPAAEQTGRVGKGLEVHRIVGGGAQCGSSYRRGLGANLKVQVTGEQITCTKCLGH